MVKSHLSTLALLCVIVLIPATGVSADVGTVIVFESQEASGGEIYITDETGANPTNLTNDGHDDREPMLCGSKIYFSSDRAGAYDIWKMDHDGTNMVNLTAGISGHAREPACHESIPLVLFTRRVGTGPGPGNIYRMGTDGSNITQLTNEPHENENVRWCGNDVIFTRNNFREPACVRPDGLVTNPGTDFQIYLMDLEGELCPTCTPARELTCANNNSPTPPVGGGCIGSNPTAFLTYWPSCHTDALGNTEVAFSAYLIGDYRAREIFTMPLCSSGCCVSHWSQANQLTFTDPGADIEDDYPSWSPSGAWISFASQRPAPDGSTDWELWKVDAIQGEQCPGCLIQITDNPVDDIIPWWVESVKVGFPGP